MHNDRHEGPGGSGRTVAETRTGWVGSVLVAIAGFTAGAATAGPVAYDIDPAHTYPSFEADHMGISVWRGKLDRTRGHVTVDREVGTGTLDLVVDLASIDFGHAELNAWAQGPQFFDVPTHPVATYRGRLERFVAGVPTRAVGELALHGVTRPVVLEIRSFHCIPHPLLKRELCGADATATLRRDEFGLDAGKAYGFSMDVRLQIQVEAIAAP
jgi:polyisoprenoid-binding protein YceI